VFPKDKGGCDVDALDAEKDDYKEIHKRLFV